MGHFFGGFVGFGRVRIFAAWIRLESNALLLMVIASLNPKISVQRQVLSVSHRGQPPHREPLQASVVAQRESRLHVRAPTDFRRLKKRSLLGRFRKASSGSMNCSRRCSHKQFDISVLRFKNEEVYNNLENVLNKIGATINNLKKDIKQDYEKQKLFVIAQFHS